MQAMIFAAGLGTRLKPLTDTMPKALVSVAGRPMLEHVINKLKSAGFDHIIINIHHFGQQIIDFVNANNSFGIDIHISDERSCLLDTGGGIQHAAHLFRPDEPVLIHNVDILSNADLRALYHHHQQSGNDATLLVNQRTTSRYLLFDARRHLQGWINKSTRQTKPEAFVYDADLYTEYAFSGIHIVSPSVFQRMEHDWQGKYSITDFYLSTCHQAQYEAFVASNLRLMDIGKPETLASAEDFIVSL